MSDTEDQTEELRRVVERDRAIFRTVIAFAISAAVSLLLWHHIGHTLTGKTDVVGYPLFANFNVNRYFDAFYLSAIVGPLLFLCTYEVIARVGPLRRSVGRRRADRRELVADGDELREPSNRSGRVLRELIRLLGVGALLGVEIVAATAITSPSSPMSEVSIALAYTGAVGLIALVIARVVTTRSWRSVASAVNLLGVGAMMPLLYGISQATSVTIASTHQVIPYHWMPLWVPVAFDLALIAYVGHRRIRNGHSVARIEQALILFVAIPIVIFTLHANLPGALGPMDPFGDGEYLAAGWMMIHGVMPWRDLYLIHGVFDDGFKGLIGYALFGPSRWASVAGISLLLNPIYWVCLYYFGALLFRRRPLFILGLALAVTIGVFVDQDPRYTFWPLVLVLLARVLKVRSWPRVLAFVIALLIQAILIPEMAFALAACALTLVAFEIYERRGPRLELRDLRTTALTVLFGAIFGGGFLIWLVAEHAITGFVGYYRNFADAHSLVGGIPLYTNYAVGTSTSALGVTLHAVAIPPSFTRYSIELIVPVLAIIATIALITVRVRTGRRLVILDWLSIAAAIMVTLYYQKGISRGDTGHIAEVYAVATPLLILLTYQLVVGLERAPLLTRQIARLHSLGASARNRLVGRAVVLIPRSPIALLSVIALLILAPSTINAAIVNVNWFMRASAPTPAEGGFVAGGPTLGYNVNAIDKVAVSDIRTIFDRYAGTDGAVFDFSNTPAVVSYLLNRKLASQFYNINDVLTPAAQATLISELTLSKPVVVLFNGLGMGAWDFIPNEIRDSTVSDYLLTNYHPLVYADGQLLLLRNGTKHHGGLPHLAGPTRTVRLYSALGTCDWGYIPNYLQTPTTPSIPPKQPSLSLGLKFIAHTADGTIYQLSRVTDLQSYHWISATVQGATGDVGLSISSFPRKSNRDITWISQGSTTTQVEVASCLQWHGYEHQLFLRYLGAGHPSALTLIG